MSLDPLKVKYRYGTGTVPVRYLCRICHGMLSFEQFFAVVERYGTILTKCEVVGTGTPFTVLPTGTIIVIRLISSIGIIRYRYPPTYRLVWYRYGRYLDTGT